MNLLNKIYNTLINKGLLLCYAWVLLVLAGLTACQSDDDPASAPNVYPFRPLTVVVEGVTTRGTTITTESLGRFSMNYLQGNTYTFIKMVANGGQHLVDGGCTSSFDSKNNTISL
jgi:hypothetical protein